MTQPDEHVLTADSPATVLRSPETPDADALEQAVPANPVDVPVELRLAADADEFDALEQARVVDLDDEYR